MLINEILQDNSYLGSKSVEYDKPKQSTKGKKMHRSYSTIKNIHKKKNLNLVV